MALWMVRAVKHGQFESKFLEEGRVYLTWGRLIQDLSKIESTQDLQKVYESLDPDAPKGKIRNGVSQVWTFVKRMQIGDWVVLPSKHKRAIHIAEITGEYTFDDTVDPPFFHFREVKWLVQDVPRTNFDQDLLNSFGAFMTVCQIKRNDAEKRVREMAVNDWQSNLLGSMGKKVQRALPAEDDSAEVKDLLEIANDQIARMIEANFKGHDLEHLVDAVLRAQGYFTYVSPIGPDKGVDILAAPGPMGFSEPRVCVQVKSGSAPLDRPTLDQLIGVMQNVHASHGLLVSWGGFKATIDKEKATQFFRVRLWDQADLIREVLENYEALGEEVRTKLPLKRIWVVATNDEDGE